MDVPLKMKGTLRTGEEFTLLHANMTNSRFLVRSRDKGSESAEGNDIYFILPVWKP